jgi:FixJ family two-component response regulator
MQSETSAKPSQPVVIVVEDDPVVCQLISCLCQSISYECRSYGSGAELLAKPIAVDRGCIIIDVRLPGMSGLDLQDELTARGNELPVIFMSGYGDIPMAVRAMKGGAVDFFVKPFRHQDLLDAIAQGLRKFDQERAAFSRRALAKSQLSLLTVREREVLREIVAGRQHKQIADDLGITQTTVKLHRGNVMRKLGAKSIADLVRIHDEMGIDHAKK